MKVEKSLGITGQGFKKKLFNWGIYHKELDSWWNITRGWVVDKGSATRFDNSMKQKINNLPNGGKWRKL
jgi:hypothetical protein